MRSQSRGNGGELSRLARKRADSARYYYPPRDEFLAIGHSHLKPASIGLNTADPAPVQIRDRLALVPPTIINKTVQRNRLRYVIALLTDVFVKRQRLLGI